MTTLLPDRAGLRRTRIRVDAASGGRARVLATTSGDPELPCLRTMILDSAPGYARVALVPDGALLLAGDAISLDVRVGTATRLDLVEPSGTVAYDMRGGEASWDVRLDLAAGASLTWAGEPFVLSAGARVRRTTDVTLGAGARLAVRETLVLGRHQERIGDLEQHWTARGPDGAELLVEHLSLGASSHRPGVLGGNRVLGSVVALGLDVPVDVAAEDRLDLDEGGTLWRRLAHEAHLAIPTEAWRAVLAAW
ncbi:urease accessory protein [Marmoricola sp. OAE513]|uniref:urease accessory protein UreD n=1 Tax=Marmoricola sp. OAE513 TaxID=2817894 RepID=UPI001AE3032F